MSKYIFKTMVSENEVNEFLKKQNCVNFMQSPNWSAVKNNWQSLLCAAYDEKENIVSTASILIKVLPLDYKMYYIPRSIAFNEYSDELFTFMIDNITKYAKEHKCINIIVDPYLTVKESYIDESNKSTLTSLIDKDMQMHKQLLKCKFIHNGFNKNLHANLQPRYQVLIPLIDDDRKYLDGYTISRNYYKRKRNIVLDDFQKQRGISYYTSTSTEDLDDFLEVINDTEQRQKVSLRSKDYYERIMNAYKGKCVLFFGKLDLEKYKEFLESTNDTEELYNVKQLLKDKKEIILSSSLVIESINDKGIKIAEYLYAGNKLLFPKLNMSFNLVHSIVNYLSKEEYSYLNLGGVSANEDDKLMKFKSQFGSILFEFIGEYNYPIKKVLYMLYKLYIKIKRNN